MKSGCIFVQFWFYRKCNFDFLFYFVCSFTGSTENPQLFVILCNSVVLCVHFTCSFSESEFALEFAQHMMGI